MSYLTHLKRTDTPNDIRWIVKYDKIGSQLSKLT